MTEAPLGGVARYNRVYWAEHYRQVEKDPMPYIAKCEVCSWEVECEDADMAEMAAGNHYNFSLPMAEYGEPVHTVRHGLKGEI